MYAGTFKEAKNPSYRFSNEKNSMESQSVFLHSKRKLLVKLVERPDFQKLYLYWMYINVHTAVVSD